MFELTVKTAKLAKLGQWFYDQEHTQAPLIARSLNLQGAVSEPAKLGAYIGFASAAGLTFGQFAALLPRIPTLKLADIGAHTPLSKVLPKGLAGCLSSPGYQKRDPLLTDDAPLFFSRPADYAHQEDRLRASIAQYLLFISGRTRGLTPHSVVQDLVNCFVPLA
jgi:hypothetical protein